MEQKLFKHQADLLEMNPKKQILAWSCGIGKTRASLEWSIKNKVTIIEHMVICPKHLLVKWERDHIDMGINPEKENILIISKETFRRDWNILPRYDKIIADEVHYFGNVTSDMTKSLLKYIKKHKIEYVLGLSATPYLSTCMNIYALGQLMGKVFEKEWSYQWFKREYFTQVRMGARYVPVERKGTYDELIEKLRDVGNVVYRGDCFDIPEDNSSMEVFQITKEQKKAIEQLQSASHIAEWTAKHQICGGYLKGDEYNDPKVIKCDKLERIVDLVNENKKIIIVCRYRGEMEMIKNTIKNKKVLLINGDIHDKQSVIDEGEASDDCVIITSASCSEGWEAKSFDTMVFYSHDFSLKNYEQMKGRIQRAGSFHQCTYISLVIKDSVDEDVYKSVVIKKMDFQIKLYKIK